VKAAEHTGGSVVADPLNDPRELDSSDLSRVGAFLAAHLPGVGRPMQRRSVCHYTMSPDEHFIVDALPQHPNVFCAAGLSGHGFKFTSVLGQALADLALEGRTGLPIQFLGLRRFSR
jgi:glycine/D-amino acid oxidase-like deaminating enzyme